MNDRSVLVPQDKTLFSGKKNSQRLKGKKKWHLRQKNSRKRRFGQFLQELGQNLLSEAANFPLLADMKKTESQMMTLKNI
ncbi:hypothetical protein EYV94_04170 [Puteibacter caeruleilacunae]|nr:hypothetical protein EYV94_04170 [Puteibacter caeruleilacunae]